VTGTPNALGTYLFTVQVTDAEGSFQSINSSISVGRRLALTGNPCVPQSPCNVEAGCTSDCPSEFGFLTGGFPPFKYKVTKGTLPTGMALSGVKLVKAFPAPGSQAGKDWVFTVRVTDAIGATADTTAKFHVFPHIALIPPLITSCSGDWATGCTFSAPLVSSLGTPNLSQVTPVVVSGPALTFAVQGLSVTGISPGNCGATPKPAGFTGVVKLAVRDTNTCATGKYCTTATATVNVTLRGCP
jgi:hypothetical protein